jgi:hypothetical protein
MTNRQIIRLYCKLRYPVGTFVDDHTRNTWCNGPYVVKKYSVFLIYENTPEDYSDWGRPKDKNDYSIYINVKNPGAESPDYHLEVTTMNSIFRYLEHKGISYGK